MAPSFSRDRLTWLMYFLLALFAFMEAAPGPVMPFLGDELELSYTVRGFHFSAFAIGLMVAGLLGERISARIGRRWALVLGGLGIAIGVVLLVTASAAAMSITGLFLIGSVGGLVFVMVQAVLADYHGTNRAIALTEANIIAAMGAGLAPLLIGTSEAIGPGWRYGMLAPVLLWLILMGSGRHITLPNAELPQDDHPSARLPLIFWGYAALIFLGVAVEWSVVYWGAEFLEEMTSLARTTAVNMMSLYFVAFIAGRLVGSRLTRRFRADQILLAAFGLTTIGFVPFWLSSSAVLSVVGLFIAGAGIANLFPLGLSLATGVVTNSQTDAASSRISLAVGTAIFLAPQILGSLADQIGLQAAYGMVAVLLVGALVWAVYLIRR